MRIICLGDSITQGFARTTNPAYTDHAVQLEESYPYRLLRNLSPTGILTVADIPNWVGNADNPATDKMLSTSLISVANAGVGGDETWEMVNRFETNVALNSPDVVVILGGVNDISAGASYATITANLDALYAACTTRGYKVIALTITPWNNGTEAKRDTIDAVNTYIRSRASESITVCDTYAALVDGASRLLKPEYSADGIHLTPAGYQVLANTVSVSDVFNIYQLDLTLGVAYPTYHLDLTLGVAATEYLLDLTLYPALRRRRQRIALGGV